MSPHDHDQLLVEGAAAGNPGSGRSAVRGTRRTATRTEEKAAGGVPTQRTRVPQKATPRAVAAKATTPTARAKTTAAKTTAKTTTGKTAAKSATVKTTAKTPAKSAAAKPTPAKTATATQATTTKPSAAKSTPKSPARRPAPPKPADADGAPAAAPARPRPRPTPRPRAAAPVVPEVAVPVLEEPRRLAMAERLRTAGRRVPPSLRRLSGLRPSAPRRRPLVYVAVLMAGALSVGLVSAGGTQAQAAGSSVSVARELGVSSQRQLLAQNSAPRTLQDMVASRAQRDAQQSAAAQTQQQAVAAATEAARPTAVLPVPPGYRLTTCYCMRWGVMHEGIDLADPIGTPEYAAMDGVVLKAGPASGFGQAIYIQHQNGDVTIYGHMEKILVQEGQVVHAGDTIALMGSEGQSTGPHLHFEVHLGGMNGPKTDPIPWLAARGVIVS